MGLFGDLDVQNAKEISFIIPEGNYEAVISNFEVKKTKDESKTGLNILYTITEEGRYKGRSVLEWQRVPQPDDTDIQTPEQRETSMGYLKKRLLSLGVPEDEINTVEAKNFIGKPVALGITVRLNPKSKEEQNQVRSVKTLDDSTQAANASTGAFGGTFQ